MKGKHLSWKTRATLISITKEMPIQHIVSGISKSQQSYYDASSTLHGSNGTYAENVNPYWCLNFRVKRLAYEVNESQKLSIEIHDYITKEFMPSLGWNRITANRLDLINNCIKGKKVEVVTHDMEEAPIYRVFSPENSSWNDFLNNCFIELFEQ